MKKIFSLAITSIAVVFTLAGCSVQQAAVSVNHGLTSGANGIHKTVSSIQHPDAADQSQAESIAKKFGNEFFTIRGWKKGNPIPGDEYMTPNLRQQFDKWAQANVYSQYDYMLKQAGSVSKLPKVSTVNLTNVQKETSVTYNGTPVKAYKMTVNVQYAASGAALAFNKMNVEVIDLNNQWQIDSVQSSN